MKYSFIISCLHSLSVCLDILQKRIKRRNKQATNFSLSCWKSSNYCSITLERFWSIFWKIITSFNITFNLYRIILFHLFVECIFSVSNLKLPPGNVLGYRLGKFQQLFSIKIFIGKYVIPELSNIIVLTWDVNKNTK